MEELVQAGSADEIRAHGRKVVTVGAVPVLVLWHEGSFRAIDNRCPHMGFFPLHQGDAHDGGLPLEQTYTIAWRLHRGEVLYE